MRIPDDSLQKLLLTSIARQELTIEQAAQRLGCATGTVQGWLRGRRPRIQHVRLIAEFCDATIETILASAGRTRP